MLDLFIYFFRVLQCLLMANSTLYENCYLCSRWCFKSIILVRMLLLYIQVHLKKIEYGEKVSKSETFIYFRSITCEGKHFKSFFVLILMIRVYSS